MRQWGKERSRNASIFVTHFPGNSTDPLHKAKAYAECLSLHSMKHNAIAMIDINEFFIFPEHLHLNPTNFPLQSQSPCVYQFERVVFGNGGQYMYEPLPVTKRFMFRIEPSQFIAPPTLSFSLNSSDVNDDAFYEKLERDIFHYLYSGRWKSDICTSNPIFPQNVAVYHYLRSVKECMKQRGDAAICNLEGTVEDQFGWEQMQYLLPAYSSFNGFL